MFSSVAVEGVSPYYLALELSFDSAQALQDSLNSDIGQAMAQDYKCFASGGVNWPLPKIPVLNSQCSVLQSIADY